MPVRPATAEAQVRFSPKVADPREPRKALRPAAAGLPHWLVGLAPVQADPLTILAGAARSGLASSAQKAAQKAAAYPLLRRRTPGLA